ncbi:hypothetical protein BABINDRAFT_180979 [Babjeviella inositovora NRRL Y-12698]|uniref:Probable metalloprotease ARX1 n=1 Tax=Babjeviella inositovora NRRL Y-12698 TaxID=984486 RepID=A0A1E3QM63_9ASCO|nr:uncharacterized protein BABINDRAFT_180979 [Babjeviella inositovora NRRL Y-12698]ODQ78786.1 hypothetical protein BABINDRAFT_180979 [Babjeviella inositovora NRRL Y-12698]
MELAVSHEDTDILLKEKNILNEDVLDKYRLAGQVSQTCLVYITNLIRDSYHLGTHKPYTAAELCLLGDSYLKSALETVYKKGSKAVRERGIAQPVTIEFNEIVAGFSPELDEASNITFNAGDIVTITLGCQIDGYTANVSHTIVIYPQGQADAETQQVKPAGPLLGGKADAVCAAHIATESVIALVGASLAPEKLPAALNAGSVVTGSHIRTLVNSIAESFNCVVVPGSRIRRIRRFLAGQAEGVVAEKEYKGVVWSESDQEEKLLNMSTKYSADASSEMVKFDKTHNSGVTSDSAIPTDEFVVIPGEVYMVDIKMATLRDIQEIGLVTLENVDQFTGKNHNQTTFSAKPSIYVRDYALSHHLRLRTSRQMLSQVDRECSVYPFKLSHTSANFPVDESKDVEAQMKAINADIQQARLGLSELVNRHLVAARPIQVAKFVPLQIILNTANPTGARGFDAEKPTLPGLELPLPRLGVSSLKMKSLMKNSIALPVAREMATIVLNNTGATSQPEVLRLTGGKTSVPSWVHSDLQLNGELAQTVSQLMQLTQGRFGIKVRECQPFNCNN